MTTSFDDLAVPAPMVASLASRGIDAPFPIQTLTLPDTLAGRDVSGRAPTGSGKTLAFGIPLVIGCPRAERRRPRRLVLVPTRELATQVAHELELLAGRKGPRVAAFFGGVPIPRNDRALDRGVDIAVACPGRLTDLIRQKMMRLDDVEVVVLDEADRMADMGFLPQVRQLLDQCRRDRQTVLFSATLDGDVDVLVRDYQRDPVRHELEVPEEELPDLSHHFWAVERAERVAVAGQVVDRMGPTVVFCRTKRGADRVAKQLAGRGVAAAAIHGDRSQNQRDRALEDFRTGRAAALVATDVAARGIHVDDVAAVVHFDPPEDPKDYVHRSGRTARAGARGAVVSLVVAEKVSMVKGLQRSLDLPRGVSPVDLAALGDPAAAPRSTASPSNRRSRTESKQRRGNERDSTRTDSKPRRSNERDSTRTDSKPRRSNERDNTRTEPTERADSPRRRRHRRRHDQSGEASRSTTESTARSGAGRDRVDSGRPGGPRRSGSGSATSRGRSSRSSSRGPRR